MKYLKIPLWLLWRLWFYTLIIITLVVLSPFLLVFSSKEQYYPSFWKVAKLWAYTVFYGMGFRIALKTKQQIDIDKNYMFCSNHTSLLDVFILMILSKNPIVFVGKKELSKIPVFGFFYRRVCILVDRSNLESRKKVYHSAKNRLQQGVSIAIYPEGLVPEEDIVLAPFKNGAFSLAIQHQIPIIPYVNFDCKRFFSWTIFKGRPGVIRVKQLEFFSTENLSISDRNNLKRKVYDSIYNELINDIKYMEDTNRFNKC